MQTKAKIPLLISDAYFTEREFDDLIAKLIICEIECRKRKSNDCVVRLDNSEISFLTEISIWWRDIH